MRARETPLCLRNFRPCRLFHPAGPLLTALNEPALYQVGHLQLTSPVGEAVISFLTRLFGIMMTGDAKVYLAGKLPSTLATQLTPPSRRSTLLIRSGQPAPSRGP